MLIDTHCHIYLEEFDEDRDSLIEASRESGIKALLLPNIDCSSVDRLRQVVEKYPEFCYPMMGLHPTSVGSDYVAELNSIQSFLSKNQYCGIGEIGIDLYWDKTFVKEQIEAFEEQLRWSADCSLPVSIHTRNAFPEVFESIHKVGYEKLKGVFHSFSGSEEDAKEIRSFKSFKLGINGMVTYKNSSLPDVLRNATTIDDIVLETDAPYLPPVPYRGKRNLPVYIRETALKVAEIYDLPMEELEIKIKKNTEQLFSVILDKTK
ncbi:TatD family hydrolase [Massilibacteroides sp.]|uniref:TatD family hydrolase n=1 Tax=Massilibacteroides sp. TaxID=2034766 RepID=UPI00262F27A3|nr:TatD family hydrolase [Massilibacteroides sp.]MDD4513938.1 TatD family hydrolase [Massilibacteroides sp.]